MSELRGLLSFMEEGDRDRVIRRYEAMFDAAGVQGEDALLNALGSPVKQAVAVERELREAQSRGETPFAGGEESPPEVKQGGASELARMLRAAAAALEDESLAEKAGQGENGGTEPLYDDDFPIGDYIFSTGGEGETSGGSGPRPGETASVPSELDEILAIFGEKTPAAAESPAGELPADEGSPAPSGEDAGEEPPHKEAPAPEKELSGVPVKEKRESRREKPAEEPAAGKKKKAGRRAKSESPGPGRVLAAAVATVPLIALDALFFVFFIALGALAVALGFGLCVTGVYIAGYVFNGTITFIPDLLLTAGGALLCLAPALLLMWTGLWIAAGGCMLTIRFSGGMYSRILGRPRTAAKEVEDVG